MARTTPLAGKTAIVCGGSKGIGLSTAAEVVRRGGSVAVVARGNGSLEAAAERLRTLVHQSSQYVDVIQADAANREDVGPEAGAFIECRGAPAYLINAPATPSGPREQPGSR